jgi:hypothetical protein
MRMEKVKLIEKFLSFFGSPFHFFLNDMKGVNNQGVNINKAFSLENAIDINEKKPAWLYFTPNGNYGETIKVGDTLRNKRLKSTAKDYIASYYVDIDFRDATKYINPKESLEHIKEQIEKNMLPVTYIVQTGWWFHLYMFVKEDERQRVAKDFEGQFKKMQEHLSTLFDGWDPHAHGIQKLMRLPFTNHRKTWDAIPTKLFRVDYDSNDLDEGKVTISAITEVKELKDLIEPEHLIHHKSIRTFINNIGEVKITGDKTSVYSLDVINGISVLEIIKKLQNYPRKTTERSYVFKTSYVWGHTHAINVHYDDWEIYYPDWYRINAEENYVNNFTFMKYDIEDRPRWWPYAFLYYYFQKDRVKIKEFLSKEFGIIIDKETLKDSQVLLALDASRGEIYFTNKEVIYTVINENKGKIIETNVQLFDIPLMIRGTVCTNYTDDLLETSIPEVKYVFQDISNWQNKEHVLNFTEDRKRFNRNYGKYRIYFKGSEMDILDFRWAVNKATDWGKLTAYRHIALNGYSAIDDEEMFIFGDRVITKDGEETWLSHVKDLGKINLNNRKPPLVYKGNHVPVKVAFDKFKWLWTPNISVIGFLWFISAALGYKYWEPIRELNSLGIGLFFSWRTKAGKSEFIKIMKALLWFNEDMNRVSIIKTTEQPLRTIALDDCLMHCEEYTINLTQTKEGIIRDIINKTETLRWLPDGTNLSYKPKANIIIDWEILSSSESVSNRLIIIPMQVKHKTGNEEILYEIKGLRMYKEYFSKCLEYRDDILDLYRESYFWFKEEIPDSRYRAIYSHLIAINTMFELIDNEILLSLIGENLQLLNSIESWEEVDIILSDLLTQFRTWVKVTDPMKWKTKYLVPTTNDWKNKSRILLIWARQKYWDQIKIVGNTLVIEIFDEGERAADELNQELMGKMLAYIHQFKSSHRRM